ncbi:Dabb family protein [Pedobacter gandavensis]|uniref:Dabb family protein n=1 Tax=Pedobacter gandavensis TaxID=2679963 RepID=UPI00292D9291|nr:Dabb family protein [Pedobacter gandavensis]
MNKSNRRKFIGTATVLTVGTVASAMPITSMNKSYPVVHHVFFWLKNPDSKADRDQLVAGVKTLSKIPTVKEIHVGIVASTEKRDVVDHSWGVSELMFFNDLAGQEAYQTHPIHLEFIKNHSHLWDKVVVYDIAQA